jgi:glycerophosphoryl diester phosphodiesterase
MLIIGHRGAAGEKPENTLASFKHAIASGADAVEFDVRLTKDNHVVLSHDFHLYRSHKKFDIVRMKTLAELKKITAGSEQPIITLEQVLKVCNGKILTIIEVKDKDCGKAVLEILTKSFKEMLGYVIITSFSSRELSRIRSINKKVKLGMLMRLNPFAFLAWERKLQLSAVGFHRLHLNKLSIQAAHQLKMFVYVYTVNRKGALNYLDKQDVDGVVTDFPALFMSKTK